MFITSIVWCILLILKKKFILGAFYWLILFLLLFRLKLLDKKLEIINNHIVNKNCIFRGYVKDIPKRTRGISGMENVFTKEYIYFPVTVNKVLCKENNINITIPIMIYIDKKIFNDVKIFGQNELTFKAKVRKIKDEVDKWKFQFKRFLYSSNLLLSVFIYKKSQILNIKEQKTFFLKRSYFYIYNLLSSNANEHTDEVNFIQALLFGATYKLSKRQLEIYINSGTYHFFAVSGFSVAVLYIFLYYFVSIFLINFRFGNIISIFIIWLYIFICGFVPSATRAGIIFTLFLLAPVFYRRENHLHSLLLSFIIILVFENPYALFDISFQYSFIIYSSIIFLFPNIRLNLIDDDRLTYRIFNHIINFFLSIILVTFIASTSLLPLSTLYFGEGKVFFIENIIANCIASIIFTLYFIVSLIFLIFILIFGGLPYLLWYIYKGVYLLEKMLSLFTHNTVYFGVPYNFSIYIFYFVMSIMCFLVYTKKLQLWKVIIVLIITKTIFMIFTFYPKRYKEGQLYSILVDKSTTYYYIKHKDEILVFSNDKFNKRLLFNTIQFLRYLRFLNGRIIYITDNNINSNKILYKGYNFILKNINVFKDEMIAVNKIKITKRLKNLFLSFENYKILYLESVDRRWLRTFLTKNKIDVVEISSFARRPIAINLLCNSSKFIINRSEKFNILCHNINVMNSGKTILIINY